MITVSIVSHGHGQMVNSLIERLLTFPQVSSIILTLNIPEVLKLRHDAKIVPIFNPVPKGYGANHNAAFIGCMTRYFCVLNPDIQLPENPFPHLLGEIESYEAALVAPIILSPEGKIEDSVRYFPTWGSLITKAIGGDDGRYDIVRGGRPFVPDLVAGMFMLFRTSAYAKLHGFDESYHLYYEDVDICRRAGRLGLIVVCCPKAYAVHAAQRASRRSLRHMRWHFQSMWRYLTSKV